MCCLFAWILSTQKARIILIIYFQLCFYLLFYQIDVIGQIKIYPKLNMGYITLMDSLTFIWRSWKMLRSTISLMGWNISPSLSMGSEVNRSLWHLSFICFLYFCPFWDMLKQRDKALWKLKKKCLPKLSLRIILLFTPTLLSVIYYQITILTIKKKGKCLHYANIT